MAASEISVAVSSTTDFSSDSTASDGWQELTKSDYAKVIFSDLLCNPEPGTVECKFQITDNVHEDPNDFVGLFRIGYEDLSQCLVSKMLSQTKCEDDGKLQRCVFTASELPCLDDGFYQFLYVTRDQEVCGASMPFLIKMSPPQLKESSVEYIASETIDNGFLLVKNEVGRNLCKECDKEKALAEPSTLSEQKKKEIAAWVSQNPDYYSLIEQIKENSFTIDALQQSKDLAMKEVAQLSDIVNAQNAELIQLKNMLAASDEKIKMTHNLLTQKDCIIDQIKTTASISEGRRSKEQELREKAEDTLKAFVGKFALSEQLQKEKQDEINDLKKELEKINSNMCQKAIAGEEGQTLECLIKKAQKLGQMVNDALTNFHPTVEENVEKLFQLKIQLLVILSKTTRTIENATEVLERGIGDVTPTSSAFDNRDTLLQNSNINIPEIEKQDIPVSSAPIPPLVNSSETEPEHDLLKLWRNFRRIDSPIGRLSIINYKKSDVTPTSSAFDNRDTLLQNSSINISEIEKQDIPISSAPIPPLVNSSETEPEHDISSNGIEEKEPFKENLKSDMCATCGRVYDESQAVCIIRDTSERQGAVHHQIIELPRLDVINEDRANLLQLNKTLDPEDITAINRLTENIKKRGFNILETIEVIDDSSSDSGSDVSEISECSSVKKDFLSVGRIIKALSSLHEHTRLQQMVVVANEEDKKWMGRKEWNVLLQKCAMHYQFEILLEHIEKQKDGMRKVSDKICELLTKVMVLKDELDDSKADHEKLQTALDKKDMDISKLKEQLETKNNILCRFCSEKEEMENDYRARLAEASHLYQKQCSKIWKLSKKLQKCKSMKDKTKSSKKESSPTASESSKEASSSFEVIPMVLTQNVNDSDTGEHMFDKTSLLPNKETITAVVPPLNLLNSKASTSEDMRYSEAAQPCEMEQKGIQAEIDSFKEKTTVTTTFESSVNPSHVNEPTQCSTQSLNHIQTLQTVQPNQQFLLRPLVQNSNTEAIANTMPAQSLIKSDHLSEAQAALLSSRANTTPVTPVPIVAGMIPDKPTTSKDWHHSVAQVLRQQLVLKIVKTIFPTCNTSDLQDKRMVNMFTYAREVECDIYEAANCREEYYQLLAEKIHEIQQQLHGKRQKMNKMQMQQQACTNLGPAFFSNSSVATSNLLSPSGELRSETPSTSTTADKLSTDAECKSHETALVFSDFASYEHFQEKIKEHFNDLKNPSRISQECYISCYVCNGIFSLSPEDLSDLTNHLESEHSMKVCPVCGQLFEDAIPQKYFHIHINQHFETE